MPWWATFAALWTVAAVTPGPNFLLVTGTAVAAGRPVAWATLAGLLTGTAAWGTAGFLGVGFLFSAAPWLYLGLKVAGGVYIAWLGIQMWRGGAEAILPAGGANASFARAWRRGLTTSLSNPKSGAFVATIFAATLPPHVGALQALEALAIMLVVSLSWYGTLVFGLGQEHVQAVYLRARRGIERVAGALFVAFGIEIATGR